jgi:hypothetical protein
MVEDGTAVTTAAHVKKGCPMSQSAQAIPKPLVVRPATVQNHFDTWSEAKLRPFAEVIRNAHPELTRGPHTGAA